MTAGVRDRKSTRLNSSHVETSYAVFCLKKKNRFDGGVATALSGGVVYAGGGTDQQQAAGVADSVDAMVRYLSLQVCFFFNDAATTEIYTLSLHDALPI